MEVISRSVIAKSWREDVINRRSKGDVQGGEIVLYDAVTVDT